MHYVQKYLDKLAIAKTNTKVNEGKKSNIYLYCNYYSFYSQKVSDHYIKAEKIKTYDNYCLSYQCNMYL